MLGSPCGRTKFFPLPFHSHPAQLGLFTDSPRYMIPPSSTRIYKPQALFATHPALLGFTSVVLPYSCVHPALLGFTNTQNVILGFINLKPYLPLTQLYWDLLVSFYRTLVYTQLYWDLQTLRTSSPTQLYWDLRCFFRNSFVTHN
jgi:hypothetical protein